jgi:hypothetical protein
MVARPLAENRRDGGYELARGCRKRKKVIGLFVHCDSPMRFRRPAGEHDYGYVCRGRLVPNAAKETLVGHAGKVEIGDYEVPTPKIEPGESRFDVGDDVHVVPFIPEGAAINRLAVGVSVGEQYACF